MVSATDLIAKFLDSTDEFEQLNSILVLASFENTTYNNRILEIFKQHSSVPRTKTVQKQQKTIIS